MAVDIRLPQFPECWETCRNCGQGEVEVLVSAGDTVREGALIARIEPA